MKIHYVSLFLSPSKQACERGADSTAKGSEIRMPVSDFIVCPSGGYAHKAC